MAYLVEDLKRHGHLDGLHMTVCFVGSRKDDKGDVVPARVWSAFAPNLTIYGFEADAAACAAMNAELEKSPLTWAEKHFPLGLWNSSGKQILHITRSASASSLYPPNERFFKRFMATDWIEPQSTVEVETTTMDTFFGNRKEDIDFLQIDVQGGELAVLEGGARMVDQSVLGIVAEVAFRELYKDQPLFADVDRFLRDHGFVLFALTDVTSYPRRDIPFRSQRGPSCPAWANAWYLRDLIVPGPNEHLRSPERFLKLACIADILEFTDFALEVLIYLTENHGTEARYNCADVILDGLYRIEGVPRDVLDSLPLVVKLRRYARRPRF